MARKGVLAAVLSLVWLPALASSGDLQVTVAGVRDSAGAVRVAIYQDNDTFGNERKALTVREAVAQEGEVTLTVKSLPAGRYAIIAYHDRNGNRKLDRRLGLIHAEGHGISNNPGSDPGRGFEDAAFVFAGAPDAVMRIELNYCHSYPAKKSSMVHSLKCWVTSSD